MNVKFEIKLTNQIRTYTLRCNVTGHREFEWSVWFLLWDKRPEFDCGSNGGPTTS